MAKQGMTNKASSRSLGRGKSVPGDAKKHESKGQPSMGEGTFGAKPTRGKRQKGS